MKDRGDEDRRFCVDFWDGIRKSLELLEMTAANESTKKRIWLRIKGAVG